MSSKGHEIIFYPKFHPDCRFNITTVRYRIIHVRDSIHNVLHGIEYSTVYNSTVLPTLCRVKGVAQC